jgi:anthranilate/para-aminobenzoate synthase component II
MILLVDGNNTDRKKIASFANVIRSLGWKCTVVRSSSDVKKVKDSKDIVRGIVLSGGPTRLVSMDTNAMSHVMYCLATFEDVPVLGVCLGFQFLNVYHGGSVRPFGKEVCGVYDLVPRRRGGSGAPVRKRHFCFNDVLDKVAPDFRVVDKVRVTSDAGGSHRDVVCHIESIDGSTSRRPFVVGVLYHPERNVGHPSPRDLFHELFFKFLDTERHPRN